MTQAPDEREAIVRWLREQAQGFDSLNLIWMGDFLRQRAYQIQNGAHLDHISEQGEGYE